MKKIHAETILIFLVALWGLSFSLTKPLLSKVGVFNFLAYRFVIGGLLITLSLVKSKKFKFDKALVKAGISSGILLFITFYCHIEGLKYTTIAKNAFIVGSSVVFIPIILLTFYRKKSSVTIVVQTLLAVTGLAMITLNSANGIINYGDLITLVGSIVYAFYLIKVEKEVCRFDANAFTAVQLNTVGMLSMIATLLVETPTFDFTTNEWISIGILSLGLTGFAYLMINIVQRYLPATNVAIMFTFEPFFATLFGWMILNETIGINVVTGGFLIISSVLLPYIKNILVRYKISLSFDKKAVNQSIQ